jgi:hypothetical protein
MSKLKARIHIDMAITKLLTDQDFHVLYNADTDQKRKIIKRSMEGGILKGMKGEYAFGGGINDDGSITSESPQEDL